MSVLSVHLTTAWAQTAPVITQQPANQTVLIDSSATFNVTASGAGPLTYQWQHNGTNLPNIIATMAGKGTEGYSGDGGAATNASLFYPDGVAADGDGNVFIADTYNSRIRKIDTNGIITTVAGNGTNGYAGDGGPATNARLSYIPGVAADSVGNLFIADVNNGRIRLVSTAGVISTVAGGTKSGFSGDGGPATNAGLNGPRGVAVDGFGNIFIADTGNYVIRKVSTNGIITTVAGRGPGRTSSIGDGGPATNGWLNGPHGVAVDGFGNIFIADTGNFVIRKVSTNGIITTVAGRGIQFDYGDGGPATNAGMGSPEGLALDAAGNIFIADGGDALIRKVDTNGIITTVVGTTLNTYSYSGDGVAATNAKLNYPSGVALDSFGNIIISDENAERIRWVGRGPKLILSNITSTNSGNYAVIVSSPYQSVTSAVVTLTVAASNTPPKIVVNDASFGFLTNLFGFNLTAAFGQMIIVDGSADLVNWTPLFTNSAGNSPVRFVDPASTNFSSHFYRARSQ